MDTLKRPPLRALIALTGLVTAAHLFLLSRLPDDWLAPAPAPVVKLETRTIAADGARASHTSPAAHPPKPSPAAQTRSIAPPASPSAPPPTASHSSVPATADPPATEHVPVAPGPAAPAQAPASPDSVVQVPGSVVLKYDVTGTARGLEYHANSELSFQHDGHQYQARLNVSAFLVGSRTDSSQGTITGHGLEPQRYSLKTRTERAAHFERDKSRISFSSNRPEAALQPGAQDRLSILLQLAAVLAADPRKQAESSQLSFQVASADSAEIWVFRVQGHEALSLPAGAMQALKLLRQPRGEFGQTVEVWMSPQVAWLPVRIRITNANGDVVDQVLRNAQR